jgi:hypothetical protein
MLETGSGDGAGIWPLRAEERHPESLSLSDEPWCAPLEVNANGFMQIAWLEMCQLCGDVYKRGILSRTRKEPTFPLRCALLLRVRMRHRAYVTLIVEQNMCLHFSYSPSCGTEIHAMPMAALP